MTKWFIGLTGEEMVQEFKVMADKVQEKIEDLDAWDKEYEQFKHKIYFPARQQCINLKTEFYMHNKLVFTYWENCLVDLDVTVKNMYREAVKLHTGRDI